MSSEESPLPMLRRVGEIAIVSLGLMLLGPVTMAYSLRGGRGRILWGQFVVGLAGTWIWIIEVPRFLNGVGWL